MVSGSNYSGAEILNYDNTYCIFIYTNNFVNSQYLRAEEL